MKLNRPKSYAAASNKMDPSENQTKRFHEACEMLKKNAAKFLENEQLSESSSEDEIDELELIKKTFSNYSDDESSNLRKIREFLQDVLTSGAVVCLICIESVKRTDQIWSCQNCYGILHMHCIQKWAKDSMHRVSTSLEEEKKDSLKWCCPKCRFEYEPSEKPLKYMCFCGKEEYPLHDNWNLPHSCGKTCDKRLKPECGHSCCLLCHPGPCPPCPKTVLVPCCCSKNKSVSRRCSSKEWVCGKPCGKQLSCKIHYCEIPCHIGKCPPCEKKSYQKCQCASLTSFRPCYDANWQCSKICGKSLECGNHICDAVCHKGSCPGCPNSGARLCPCGKKTDVISCIESVLPCGDTCNKLLECELHRCSQRCHYGNCERCLQMRIMKCRCGQREKSVPCCKEFFCEIKCKNRRDCGRHNCNRKCCLGNCPPCELVCGRTLNCGYHKCTSLCHAGPCYPCREIVDVKCNCGSTKVSVPCGRKKSAVPPCCSSDCKLPSDCHHQKRHKHKCHFGPCPPCRLVCENNLNCGHTCSYRCHSAVLTKIEIKEKKEGPWDLKNSFKMELVSKPCPPCRAPIPVTCLGGHETVNLPCFLAKSTSCGRLCGRNLACDNHKCTLQCHKVEDIMDLMKLSEECKKCDEPCQNNRNQGCLHPCPRPCHPGKCAPCKQHIKLKCHCQINALYINCNEWTSADENKQAELQTCSNKCPKEMACGHHCFLLCHKGPCSSSENCKKKVIIRCPCKRKKKEVQCLTQTEKQADFLCDEECREYKESQHALEYEKISKKEAEEKRIQERELQNFLKKSEGKKKKKKKLIENNQTHDYTLVKKIAFFIVILSLIGILISYLSNGM